VNDAARFFGINCSLRRSLCRKQPFNKASKTPACSTLAAGTIGIVIFPKPLTVGLSNDNRPKQFRAKVKVRLRQNLIFSRRDL
jgi:hypothetical protein